MILRALVLRPLLRRPWRALVTVVGVAAGVAAVVSTVAASRAAIRAFSEGVDEVAGAVRLEVSATGGVPVDVLGELRPVTSDAVVVPVVDQVALLLELGDGVRVLGTDLLVDGQVRPVLDQEAARRVVDEALTGRGVLMARALAGQIGVDVGDEITLSARARPEPLQVVALFDAGGLGRVWERVVVMDVALAQELFGEPRRVDRIELAPRPGIDVGALRERVAALVGPGLDVAPPSRRRETAEQLVASLRFNLVALSAISVLVGGVLVATTLATSVVQRRATLALLRSMGASRGQIAGAVLTEALLIGLLGGAAGVGAGLLGARAALTSVRYSVATILRGGLVSGISAEPWLVAAGMLVAVAVSVAAAALPLQEALRVPPLQGLRDDPPSRLTRASIVRDLAILSMLALAAWWLAGRQAWLGLPLAALLACLALLALLLSGSRLLLDGLARIGARPLARLHGTALRLASAALSAGRRRAAWAAGAVGVAVALAAAIVTLVGSFRTTVEHWTEAGMRSDVWVRPLAPERGVPSGQLDPEVVRIAEELFGPAAVDPFYSIDITYRGRPVSLGFAAFDVVAEHGGGVAFPGRDRREVFAEAYAEHGAVVNEPFANRFGVAPGDTLRLDLPGGSLEVPVIAVFPDYSRAHGLVVVDRHLVLPRVPGRGPLDMAVFLPDGADPSAARQRLLEALRGRFLVEAFLAGELRAEVLAAFERTFAITTALYLVAAAVAVVAVVTVLLTLVGERRRELATLRAMGASRRQLTAMVLAEAGLLGLAAAGAGLAVGLAVGVILVEVVNLQSFGWSLELVLPWREVAEMGGWVVAACLVAGLAPALAALRLHPADVLREDA